MEKICKNCKNWQNGICTVKYIYNNTDEYHKCDEISIPAKATDDGKPVMFFNPNTERNDC